MAFWQPNFWREGFWKDNFWAGMNAGAALAPPVWTSLIYFFPDAVIGTSINLNLGQYAFSPEGFPLTISVQSGSLPSGLFLSSAGVISGTYSATGTFQFVLVANDTSGGSAVTNLITMTVINTGFVLLQNAISTLDNAGFVVSQPIQHVTSNTVPAGYVVSQSPPAGTLGQPNTPVLLVVSDGPSNVITNPVVGNYVGMFYLDAQRSMALNNIGTTNPIWQNSSVVADTVVISQSIASGTPVAPGTAVTLTVSMGTAPVLGGISGITIPVAH